MREVRKRWARSNALADALYVPIAMADMAGQLMVHGYEVGAPLPPRQTTFVLGLGDAQDTAAFLNKPWDEALEEFAARGVVSENELSRLLIDYAERSKEARRALLETVQKRVYELLTQAIAEGQQFRQFANQLREEAPGLGISASDPHYLSTVFRTNIQSAYGAGRHRALSDPDVVASRPFRQIRTSGDARVRDEHAQLDGLVFRADGPLAALKTPLGFNCFPGDVEVQGTFNAGTRALYDGEIVEITTQHGRRLTVTPNHPVATVHGFVSAGSVREGDQLLGYEGPVQLDQRTAGTAVRPNATAVHEHNAPTTIKEVFGALAHAGGRCAHRRNPDDFHGDALFFESDIDVVGAEWKLTNRNETGASEDAGNLRLSSSHLAVESQERREGDGSLLRGRLGAASRGTPRSAALAPNSGGVTLELRPLRQFRFGPAANLHASRYEYAADGAAGDPKFVRDLLLGGAPAVRRDDCGIIKRKSLTTSLTAATLQVDEDGVRGDADVTGDVGGGLAGFVSPDYVVGVRNLPYRGHVYDLQSPYGWIVANGIVTSNCRCGIVSLATWDGDVVDELPAGAVAPGFG